MKAFYEKAVNLKLDFAGKRRYGVFKAKYNQYFNEEELLYY